MSGHAEGFVWRHSPYTGSRLIIHLAIADVVNDVHRNEFWMLVENLAAKTRLGRSTVSASLTQMVEDGFLEVLTEGGGRGRPTHYRFLMPKTVQNVDGLGQETVQGSDGKTRETIQNTGGPLLTNENVTTTVSLSPSVDKVLTVFDAWRAATGRNGNTKLTPERRKAIARALTDYPIEDVLAAVEGWKHDPWPDRPRHNDVAVLLRNGQQVEKFRDLRLRHVARQRPQGHEKADPNCPRCQGRGHYWNASGGMEVICSCATPVDKPVDNS